MKIVDRSTGEVLDLDADEIKRRVASNELHVWSTEWLPGVSWISASDYHAAVGTRS